MVKLIKRWAMDREPSAQQGRLEIKPLTLDQVRAPSSDSPDSPESEDPMVRAKREADIIVRTARSEADSVRDAAHAEGYSAGIAEAAEAVDGLIRRLEESIAEVVAQRNTLIEDVEPQMLKLVMQIVEKVIRHEVRTDPRVVERLIEACLRQVRDSREVCVRVSPGELEKVRALRDELIGSVDGLQTLRVISDRRVPEGGCVVESDSATLDARIGTQLNRLRDKLMEAFENGRREARPGPDEVHPDNPKREPGQR